MTVDVIVAGRALWPVAIPLAGAALSMLVRRRQLLQRTVMEAAVVLMFFSAVSLLASLDPGQPAIMKFGGWGAPFGVTFVADQLSAALCTVAGMVALAVAVFARADIRARRRRAGFDPLFLAMLAAVNGAFLTGDIFNLYVWFELMLVTAIGLMTLDRRRAQIDGALRYAAMSMLGATFILIGIALLYGEAGTLDMADLSRTLAGHPPSVALSASAYLLLAGFALKAGLFPLFFWLPASYHTAPISVTAALAGLLTKVAFYACLRVFVVIFDLTGLPVVAGLPRLLALIAGATMLVSVIAAIAQADVRRLLAYHVMGQVAYLMMGLAIATIYGVAASIFYTMHTMLVQAGLFLCAGAMARANRGYNLAAAGGLMRDQPFFTALFAILALSISGVPPLSGFWAKFLVIDAALRGEGPWDAWLAVIALVTGILTLYSMSIVWTRGFWRTPDDERRSTRRIPGAMLLAIALLAASTIGIGLAVEPMARFSRESANQLQARAVTPIVEGVTR
ncbi:MAG TPA: proton-conducting transporter membrane subunit [Gemmatimonadaceae bacterium]|nr:proton-conducting transporter membrane subunit [Gemmatimonadaceae bacterium]